MASLKDLKVELNDIDRSIHGIQRKIQTLLEKQEKLQNRKKHLEQEITQREKNYFGNKEEESEISWSSSDFPWSENLKSVLWERFGIRKLRSMQLETINATMSKRDVILIMPTGGGKSLCYQAPAILTTGITLVISPLISLIEDQIISLQNFGVEATKLSASSTKEEVNATHKEMINKNPSLKLLYVTPEKISKSKRFMSQLEKCYKAGNLSRIAVDEVHCASQWGNDFRPDYKILGILKRQFPNTPLLGLTATSTDKVTLDTKKILSIPFAMVFKTPLNRSNLFYEVRRKPDSCDKVIQDILKTISAGFQNSSGIIYCFSCKNCEEVCKKLCTNGIAAAVYHAKLPPDERSRVHKMWLEDKIQVICATVAFGMGIDKPDVRFVIHYSLSKSVENYYQESGRAGRDHLPALCLLYYGFSDVFRQSTMVLTEQTGLENVNQILEYCQNVKRCRRIKIFSHFGEEWDPSLCNGSCDVCSSNQEHSDADITEICSALVNAAHSGSSANERLTGVKMKEAARGRGKFKTSNSALKSLSESHLERIIIFMLLKQYLKEEFHFTPYSTISYLVPGPRASMLTIETARLVLPEVADRGMDSYNRFCVKQENEKSVPKPNNKRLRVDSDSSEGSSGDNKHAKLCAENNISGSGGQSSMNFRKQQQSIVISDTDSEEDFVT